MGKRDTRWADQKRNSSEVAGKHFRAMTDRNGKGTGVWRPRAEKADKLGKGQVQKTIAGTEKMVGHDNGKAGPGCETEKERSSGKNSEQIELNQEESWAERCIVVGMIEPTEASQVKKILENNGHKGFRVAKLTEELWILEHQDEEARKNLLEEEESWVTQWFIVMRPWEKRDINGKRRVWISVRVWSTFAWMDTGEFCKK